jgi:hypothetical protein
VALFSLICFWNFWPFIIIIGLVLPIVTLFIERNAAVGVLHSRDLFLRTMLFHCNCIFFRRLTKKKNSSHLNVSVLYSA